MVARLSVLGRRGTVTESFLLDPGEDEGFPALVTYKDAHTHISISKITAQILRHHPGPERLTSSFSILSINLFILE